MSFFWVYILSLAFAGLGIFVAGYNFGYTHGLCKQLEADLDD